MNMEAPANDKSKVTDLIAQIKGLVTELEAANSGEEATEPTAPEAPVAPEIPMGMGAKARGEIGL